MLFPGHSFTYIFHSICPDLNSSILKVFFFGIRSMHLGLIWESYYYYYYYHSYKLRHPTKILFEIKYYRGFNLRYPY